LCRRSRHARGPKATTEARDSIEASAGETAAEAAVRGAAKAASRGAAKAASRGAAKAATDATGAEAAGAEATAGSAAGRVLWGSGRKDDSKGLRLKPQSTAHVGWSAEERVCATAAHERSRASTEEIVRVGLGGVVHLIAGGVGG
jgi:hypothetical protein